MRGTVLVEGGRSGFDVLDMPGGDYQQVTYNFDNAHDGNVAFDFDGDKETDFTIEYTGLEPITSTITASDITLNYSSSTETITVTDAGDGRTTVASTLGEITTFDNPTNSLTINAGGGDDQIVIIDVLGKYC